MVVVAVLYTTYTANSLLVADIFHFEHRPAFCVSVKTPIELVVPKMNAKVHASNAI